MLASILVRLAEGIDGELSPEVETRFVLEVAADDADILERIKVRLSNDICSYIPRNVFVDRENRDNLSKNEATSKMFQLGVRACCLRPPPKQIVACNTNLL